MIKNVLAAALYQSQQGLVYSCRPIDICSSTAEKLSANENKRDIEEKEKSNKLVKFHHD